MLDSTVVCRRALGCEWGGTPDRIKKSARDQVIRENPASRGTEASAEVLVGPPGRMVSNAGQQHTAVVLD